MRWLIALVLASGCSQVFGLEDPTRRIDGGTVDDDAPNILIDAAPDADLTPVGLMDILADLSLTTGLLVALDAADIDSYDGTGATWNNLVATGPDFYRGDDAGAEGADPTFVGTAGMRTANEYFLMDGNDFFREAATGWGDDSFHHNDAKVTYVAITWATAAVTIFANCRCNEANTTTPGLVFYRSGSSGKQAYFQEGDSNLGYQTTMDAAFLQNNWSFAALSIDANGGSSDMLHVADLAVEPYPDEAENYGANAADARAMIGGLPSSNSSPDGTRFAIVLIWARALTAAELASLYSTLKTERFPSLP